MISRLTAIATIVAILTTASLALATSRDAEANAAQPAVETMHTVQLPTVVVLVKRLPA